MGDVGRMGSVSILVLPQCCPRPMSTGDWLDDVLRDVISRRAPQSDLPWLNLTRPWTLTWRPSQGQGRFKAHQPRLPGSEQPGV